LAEEKFCGMCGAALRISPEVYPQQAVRAVPISAARGSGPEPSRRNNFPEQAIDAALQRTAARGGHEEMESPWTRPERILPSFDVQSELAESVPYRYRRLYAGLFLAMLLGILVYMASRSAKTISGSASTPSPAAGVTPPSPEAPAASPQPETVGSASPEGTAPASEVRSEKQPAATSRKSKRAGRSNAPRIVTAAASSSAVTSDASGAQELAIAEEYLNGTQGTSRDRREAAQWLWKAVGKGNLAATTTLSDLYLRGDGVPKDCDQARLLLDAAARKGEKAAAERLRNLPAFGCE
jgi:hypothetical protein